MALLNIEAKLRATSVCGEVLSDGVTGLDGVKEDRIYVRMKRRVKTMVEKSPRFGGAPGHGDRYPDSWKHNQFPMGNVQLSFGKEPMGAGGTGSGGEFEVDIDIDLRRGMAHIWEWIYNNCLKPGHKTDQADVYGLLFGQGICPHYTLQAGRD